MALRPGSGKTKEELQAERQAAEEGVLLREVDDAVRQDQYASFAKSYGRPLLAIVVIGLLAFGGYLFWHSQREGEREKESETLVSALDHYEAGNLGTSADAVAELAKSGEPGAKAAAMLLQAGTALQQDKVDDAAKIYAALAADEKAPEALRNLAKIREVAATYDTMKPEEVIAALKPLAVPGNPWFGNAGELVAMAYLQQGKKDEAGTLFGAIAKDEDVPDSLRSRSRQMAGLLGVDAIVDVDEIVGAQDGAGGAPSAPPAAAPAQ